MGHGGPKSPGLLDARGGLRDLSAHVPDIAGDLLADLSPLRALDPESLPLVHGTPRLGACVGQIGKFICIGLNYSDHAAESGMAVPPEPVIFAKYTSAVCGPDDPIIIPRGSVKTDWEVELAFVIGKRGKYIAEAEAMNHVAGFFVCNDVSERSFQANARASGPRASRRTTSAPSAPGWSRLTRWPTPATCTCGWM